MNASRQSLDKKKLLSSDYYRNKKYYCVENHWRKIFSDYLTITELRNLTELTFYRKLLVISDYYRNETYLSVDNPETKVFSAEPTYRN